MSYLNRMLGIRLTPAEVFQTRLAIAHKISGYRPRTQYNTDMLDNYIALAKRFRQLDDRYAEDELK